MMQYDKDTISELHTKMKENPESFIEEYKLLFRDAFETARESNSNMEEEALGTFAHSQAIYFLTFPFLNKEVMTMEEATYAMTEIDYKLALHKKYNVIEI